MCNVRVEVGMNATVKCIPSSPVVSAVLSAGREHRGGD